MKLFYFEIKGSFRISFLNDEKDQNQLRISAKNDFKTIFEISVLKLKANFRRLQIILHAKTLLQVFI